MINAYHANFLRCLSGLEVEFLVIGGQARERHGGSASTDLDLWVNHSKENLDRFCKVFDEWLRNFRHHVSSKYGADPDNAKKVLSWEACGRVA